MEQMATNNLKKILTENGINQTELANKIKMAAGTINRICSKKYKPAPTSQNKILLGVNELSDKNYNLTDIFPNSN